MKEGSMISLLILVTFTTLCLNSFSEGLLLNLSPYGSMMRPGGMYHSPLMYNQYHSPMHMMPHYGYGPYGMNHYGMGGMYHHLRRRSVPQSGKSKKRESNSKLKREKKEDESSSTSESSSEEEIVVDNSRSDDDHNHPPSVIVRHNGNTLFESDKCVVGKSAEKDIKNQTIPILGFNHLYPHQKIHGNPKDHQSILPNNPMWQNSPFLEGANFDQSHLLNNLVMANQLPSLAQLPQNQNYELSPSLPLVPPQSPNNIQQHIMPHQHVLPPVQPIIPQYGYQQPLQQPMIQQPIIQAPQSPNYIQVQPPVQPMIPQYGYQQSITPQMTPLQQPLIQQPIIQASTPAYDQIPNQPLSSHYMAPVDQQIYQNQIMNHPQIPIQMPPSNHNPSMGQPIVFVPHQIYHPKTYHISPTPSKLHRTPACQNPPCTSLYGKHSPDQHSGPNRFYNFLNPNRYMDSIDQFMHPYIFT